MQAHYNARGHVMPIKVIGIVGSYRKGKTIDSAVSAILEGAEARGAETKKIDLLDKRIEFCTNCRDCTQENTEARRGKCVHKDDMESILAEIDGTEGIVLGSPVNFSNVTAIMKRFIERLVPYGYWPWGTPAPKFRIAKLDKKAVVVTSSACPAFIGRIAYRGTLKLLKAAARCVGARVVRSLYFGPVAGTKDAQLGEKALGKARKAGQDLVGKIQMARGAEPTSLTY
jgi:NAD(P)H-dependent FMN reductase